MQVIIHPNDSGGVAVLTPILECGLTLEQIALKDVPRGLPFLIIDAADVPDRMFFNAFEADFSTPHGHGADWGSGSHNGVVGWNNDGSPVTEWREV